MYHTRVSLRHPRQVLLCTAVAAVTALACAETHYAELHWPLADADPELPTQPLHDSLSNGVGLRAWAMTWGPDSLSVELELVNLGDGVLTVERASILLAWEELEYAPEPPETGLAGEPPDPRQLELGAREHARLRLRYAIGRPLNSSGARLWVRAASRDGVAIVETPTLEVPAMPDQ